MNALTISDTGSTCIEGYFHLQNTRPFRTEHPLSLVAQKSIFTKIYLAISFKFDYVKADGDLSNYFPDFITRDSNETVWIIETKSPEELDLPQKMSRLSQWCAYGTAAEENGTRYDFL
jgi:type III restriction enzyme